MANHRRRNEKISRYNGRCGLIKTILQQIDKKDTFSEAELIKGYRLFTHKEPTRAQISSEVVGLDGNAIIDSFGNFKFCFKNLALEVRTLKKDREAADINEARLAKIIFSSKDKNLNK